MPFYVFFRFAAKPIIVANIFTGLDPGSRRTAGAQFVNFSLKLAGRNGVHFCCDNVQKATNRGIIWHSWHDVPLC
jgi:hypothetical protein